MPPEGIKLHAGTLHHENAQMLVHEVFVHHSGCPTGARKWHISCFAMLLHSKIHCTRAAHHENRQNSSVHEVLCIIPGCPEGAREWHILFFAMLLHSKNAGRTGITRRVPRLSCMKSVLPPDGGGQGHQHGIDLQPPHQHGRRQQQLGQDGIPGVASGGAHGPPGPDPRC